MKMKLMFWISVFLINLQVVFAQTGLFSAEGANSYVKLGISIVITFFVVKEIGKRIFTFKNKNES